MGLIARGKNALCGDHVREGEVGRQDRQGLSTTGGGGLHRNIRDSHASPIDGGIVEIAGRPGGYGSGRKIGGAARSGRPYAARDGTGQVDMRGHLCGEDSDAFGTTFFAEGNTLAGVNGDAAAEIGQGKVGDAIAAIDGTEDGKQGLVLGDAEQLAITQRIPTWGKVASKNEDGPEKGFCIHGIVDFTG